MPALALSQTARASRCWAGLGQIAFEQAVAQRQAGIGGGLGGRRIRVHVGAHARPDQQVGRRPPDRFQIRRPDVTVPSDAVSEENGFAAAVALTPCRRSRRVPLTPPTIRSLPFWVHVAAIDGSAVHTQKSVPMLTVRS